MIRLPSQKPLVCDINIIPYVDVLLVLLIVFMVASPMLSQGIKVDLPLGQKSPSISDTQPIIVSLNLAGEFFLNTSQSPHQALSVEAILIQVLAEHRINPKNPILINADQALSYGQVAKVMSLLQEVGINKVSLVTQSGEL